MAESQADILRRAAGFYPIQAKAMLAGADALEEVEGLRKVDAAARAYRRAMFAPGLVAETIIAARRALWASLGPDDALDQTPPEEVEDG